ncbi:MAG: autotransporter domain-containing protein [Alphaproteobacteria bacterium]|nr:autotransporter domain-containing protein [Alphaproteobacteria bacterium]
MKKKLLLTTALVAFAMPAWAGTYDGGTFDGTKIETNGTRAEGGVEKITNGNSLTVENATFKNNIATSVGGVFAVGTTGDNSLTLKNTNFYNNHAVYDGGAVGTYKGLVIEGGIFEGNTAQLTGANWDQGVEDDKPVGGGALSLGAESVTKVSSISGAQFNKNKSGKNGGAIGTRLGANANNSAAKLDIEASFTGNQALNNGGAIYNTFYTDNGLNKGKGVTVKGTFTSNTAGVSGGAIFNDGEKDRAGNDGGVMTIADSTFTGNTSVVDGGAIYNTGELSITDAIFESNKASVNGNADEGYGGAIFSVGRDVTIANSEFTGNTAYVSGAIHESMNSTGEMSIENSNFTNNHAAADGGAVSISKKATIDTAVFTSNTAGLSEGNVTASTETNGGGAIFVAQKGNATLTNVEFYNNKSGAHGGAIASRHFANQGYITLGAAIFDGNEASEEGGALASIYDGVIDITDSTFTNNKAGTEGGAIYIGKATNYAGNASVESTNGGTLNLSGTNVFTGNTAGGKANDIYNSGTINVSGELTLDGGIAGDGTLTFESGSTLGATYNTTKIENKTDLSGLQKIKLAISEVVDSLELDNLFTHKDNAEDGYGYNSAGLTIENSMYDFTLDESDKTYSKYTVAQKSSEEIAENLGTTTEDASALLSATSSSSDNQAFNEAAGALSVAAQSGDASAVSEAKKLGATETPVVSSQETGVHDVLFGVVTSELNGEHGAMARGLASGDYFRKASAWIRGLFNKADHETTNKAEGFNSDTYGVAMGIDSEVNENTRLGFGYANSQTDIKSAGRDTDVDTNSLFVYAKYQPKDWYINTILAYSWSEYDEKKSVMGYDASAKYDVDTIALQSMYGYETAYKCYDVTPEFGLRYLHIDQDAYKNKLGSEVSANQEDVLTAVFGAKLAKNYALENGAVVRPELRAAVTYDLFDADNSANVLLANGASYTVDGEKLDRLGFELGAKVTTKATEKVEVSAGYLTRIREDYQDHTLTVDAKYNF